LTKQNIKQNKSKFDLFISIKIPQQHCVS